MSDFDENDIIPESDFDAEDVVEVVASSREPSVQEEAPVEDPIGDATRSMMGGATGFAIGSAIDHAARHGGDALMKSKFVGGLDGEDVEKIAQNRDIYKELPKRNPLESMLEQFRTLGEQNRDGSSKAADEARKAIRGQKPIPVEDIYKAMAKQAELPEFSSEIAPNKAQELLGDELDRMYPTLEDKQFAAQKVDDDLADVENQLQSPYVNERAEINQAAKDAKFENRMEQIQPKLATTAQNIDTVDQAGDEFKGKKEARQLQRMDEKIAKLEQKAAEKPKAVEQLENIQKRKEDFLYNQVNSKTKTSTTREVRNQKQFDAAENRKSQLELNKIVEDEKATQLRLLEEVKRKEKLLEQKRALEEKKLKIAQKIERSVNKAAEKADANLQKIKQAPAEILRVSPTLQNRSLGEAYGDALEDVVKDIRHSEVVDPIRLDKKIGELREGNINYNSSGAVNNFNKDIARSLGDILKDENSPHYSPEYAAGMQKSHESRKTEALFDKLGIKYNSDLNRTTLENSGRSRLNQILLTPDKYPQEYAYLKEALEDSSKNGYLQEQVADVLKRGELAALKGDVNRIRQGGDVNAFDVNSVVKGEYSRAPGIFTKLGGTRLQELYGMYRDSKAANALKAGSKFGLPAAGALIGGMAAANAAEAGEISPEQAQAATLAESVNPIPFTDSVESIKAGNEAYNESLAEGDSELMANLKAAGGATEGFFKPLTEGLSNAVPAVDQMLEGGFKAAKNVLEGFGTNQAHNARSRMEQNLKASEPKLDEDFKSFVEARPEQVEELAHFFSSNPSTQAFVAPLEKAAQGDNRTRSAVLFGLYQQPAFRQALKNRK